MLTWSSSPGFRDMSGVGSERSRDEVPFSTRLAEEVVLERDGRERREEAVEASQALLRASVVLQHWLYDKFCELREVIG